MPQSREDFLKKYISFSLFTPKLPPLGAKGKEIYNFVFHYPTYARNILLYSTIRSQSLNTFKLSRKINYSELLKHP